MAPKTRILAIDDNPTNLTIVEETLEDAYELHLALDGEKALLNAPELQPDVVLVDVMMPGIDGFEVCRRFKRHKRLKQCRVIMVSAKTQLEARLEGFEAGADDYVTKSFCGAELRTKIDFAIRAKRLEQLCGATGELLTYMAAARDIVGMRDLEWTRTFSEMLVRSLQANVDIEGADQLRADDVGRAAVLRDIGVLSIPARLREADFPAASDDLDRMRQHTLVGSRLLQRFAGEYPEEHVFEVAAEVARSHHENFDGSGYPDRLCGNAIPLSARLVRVVAAVEEIMNRFPPDTPEASDRVYEAIVNGSGTQFAPEIVEAFVHINNHDLDLAGVADVTLATGCER